MLDYGDKTGLAPLTVSKLAGPITDIGHAPCCQSTHGLL
jgi:hypothetical protein